MGSSEHALQHHMSDWSSCAIWDLYVARDRNPTRMAVSGEKNGFGTKNRVSAFNIIEYLMPLLSREGEGRITGNPWVFGVLRQDVTVTGPSMPIAAASAIVAI